MTLININEMSKEISGHTVIGRMSIKIESGSLIVFKCISSISHVFLDILLGSEDPTNGSISFDEKASIGAYLQEFQAYENMTVASYFNLFKDIYGMDNAYIKELMMNAGIFDKKDMRKYN